MNVRSAAVTQAGRRRSARRVVPRSPYCAESRRSGCVSSRKFTTTAASVRIFESDVAKYVPTKQDPMAAHFCDLRANPNATWNENFIQHCKMQEIANHCGSLCFAYSRACRGRSSLVSRSRRGRNDVCAPDRQPWKHSRRLKKSRTLERDGSGMALAICEQCEFDEEQADAQPTSDTTYIGKR